MLKVWKVFIPLGDECHFRWLNLLIDKFLRKWYFFGREECSIELGEGKNSPFSIKLKCWLSIGVKKWLYVKSYQKRLDSYGAKKFLFSLRANETNYLVMSRIKIDDFWCILGFLRVIFAAIREKDYEKEKSDYFNRLSCSKKRLVDIKIPWWINCKFTWKLIILLRSKRNIYHDTKLTKNTWKPLFIGNSLVGMVYIV